MRTTDVICGGSSPSSPGAAKAQSSMADAFGSFCALAVPVELGVRDLFEQAMEAETPAGLQAIWQELIDRRAERGRY